MSEIKYLLEFTSPRQKIEIAYQKARRGLKKGMKNDGELTE